MNATQHLQAAIACLAERGKQYDNPEGERSMEATVDAFEAVTGHSLTVTQGWLFMALLKAVRTQQGEYKADSFIDGAAYFALAGESAAQAAPNESFGPDSIDWSKATEGATHFGPKIDGHEECWFKVYGANQLFSFHKGMAWRAYSGGIPAKRFQSLIKRPIDWDESRIDIIGQNGNGGEHYPGSSAPPHDR